MEDDLRRQLLALTADFYRTHSESFDESRQNAWDSWQRIRDETSTPQPPNSVLDLGCGNGRFAGFFHETIAPEAKYTGYDTEPAFIAAARTRYPGLTFDIATIDDALQTSERFDLVVAFGLFHHLPGSDYREQVLASIKRVLTNVGCAVISLWQPKRLKNFASKIKDNALPGLEDGDFLMGWNGDFSKLRYCHHFDDDEIQRLVARSPFHAFSQFQGTGNYVTNQYLILR